MTEHPEPSAGALAHGAAKSDDIARVRRDLGAAQIGAARALQRAAARYRRDVRRQADPGVRAARPDDP